MIKGMYIDTNEDNFRIFDLYFRFHKINVKPKYYKTINEYLNAAKRLKMKFIVIDSNIQNEDENYTLKELIEAFKTINLFIVVLSNSDKIYRNVDMSINKEHFLSDSKYYCDEIKMIDTYVLMHEIFYYTGKIERYQEEIIPVFATDIAEAKTYSSLKVVENAFEKIINKYKKYTFKIKKYCQNI